MSSINSGSAASVSVVSVVSNSVVSDSVDSSAIFWSDPYDTYDVRVSSLCHCCNNPINKIKFCLSSARPYGQGQNIMYAYYFCTKECKDMFYCTALELTNKKLDDVLEIDGHPGLWSIQSKYPASSFGDVGLYLYRIKNKIIYSRIYIWIPISTINQAKIVDRVYNFVVDGYTRYLDDGQGDEGQGDEVQSDEVQSLIHSSDNLTSY